MVGKPRLKKKYVFVPGRWYQVRVAAVNMHGSRGFSPPSEAFTMSRRKYANPSGDLRRDVGDYDASLLKEIL